jgi:hypothetical protein
MKAIAFSFGTATPLIVTVFPEGGALDAGQPPVVVTPDEPPVATPDEPPPEPPPEDGIAPVDEAPLDGLPVDEPELEPVDGGDDPERDTVPLLLPLSVPVLAPPPNSGRGAEVLARSWPWCS